MTVAAARKANLKRFWYWEGQILVDTELPNGIPEGWPNEGPNAALFPQGLSGPCVTSHFPEPEVFATKADAMLHLADTYEKQAEAQMAEAQASRNYAIELREHWGKVGAQSAS